MDETWEELVRKLDELERENLNLHAAIQQSLTDLYSSETELHDWEDRFVSCTEELDFLKEHLERMRCTWADEWGKEFESGFES